MLEVYIDGFAYETELGNEQTRGLLGGQAGASATPEAGDGRWSDLGFDRRARRELSRQAALSVSAARRCLERCVDQSDRERLALFVGCSSGPEIAETFVEHMAKLAGSGTDEQAYRVFVEGAGNVLDYLRSSVGNLPGHIAKHTGVRGVNACFTGAAAGYFALRKAVRLLAHGAIERAVVIAGESLAGDARPREFGAAFCLSTQPGRVRVRVDVEGPANAATRGSHFECCTSLVTLAAALEDVGGGSRTYQFVETDHWGRTFGYQLLIGER